VVARRGRPLSGGTGLTLSWVAPVAAGVFGVAGVFFTWLAGHQGRKQVERMAARSEISRRLEKSGEERRNAYLSALSLFRLELMRMRYERRQYTVGLDEIDRIWNREDRIRLVIDASTAVDTFGSQEARDCIQQWSEVGNDEALRRSIYERFLRVARRELGETYLQTTIDLHKS